MTKIAVYGDSFSSDFQGWPRDLQSLYKGSHVDTFGVSGSSANYSYMKFLETHEKYDIVVFLWTSITRNGLIDRNFKDKKYNVYGFSESEFDDEDYKNNIEKNIKFNLEKTKKKVSEFIEMDEKWIHYESVYAIKYPSKNFLENCAMRDSVKFRKPDAINVECFYTPEISNYGISQITLFDWCKFTTKFEVKSKIPYKEVDGKRLNHLTPKQNKEFAEYLYKHINVNDFDIHKTFKNPEKYYTMSKTLEESGFVV